MRGREETCVRKNDEEEARREGGKEKRGKLLMRGR